MKSFPSQAGEMDGSVCEARTTYLGGSEFESPRPRLNKVWSHVSVMSGPLVERWEVWLLQLWTKSVPSKGKSTHIQMHTSTHTQSVYHKKDLPLPCSSPRCFSSGHSSQGGIDQPTQPQVLRPCGRSLMGTLPKEILPIHNRPVNITLSRYQGVRTSFSSRFDFWSYHWENLKD